MLERAWHDAPAPGPERPTLPPEIIRDAEGRSFDDFAREAEEAAVAGDVEREERVRKAQARFLYDRYAKRFPDILQIPREVKGFYFFEVNERNAARGAKASRAVLSGLDAFEKDPTSDEWKRIVDERRDEIMAEWRINVRPQKEYVPAAAERLAEMFAASPELREIASSFKVKIGPSKRPGETGRGFAEIIIYGANDTAVGDDGVPVAKRNHEKLLAAVKDALADLEPHAQEPGLRRMTQPVTDLLSVQQSGGDFRSLLKKVDAARDTAYLDDYFDAETGHAFARDDAAEGRRTKAA